MRPLLASSGGGTMTPVAIIREAQKDGVRLYLTPAGTIEVAGAIEAVDRWLRSIRTRKAEIIRLLKDR